MCYVWVNMTELRVCNTGLSNQIISPLGGLFDETKDEQWRRAMDYVSLVSELNYMTQIVIMLYEDQTKDLTSDDR